MLDEHGDIRFSKIYEWMLLTEGMSFYDFLLARMRNSSKLNLLSS